MYDTKGSSYQVHQTSQPRYAEIGEKMIGNGKDERGYRRRLGRFSTVRYVYQQRVERSYIGYNVPAADAAEFSENVPTQGSGFIIGDGQHQKIC